MSKLSKEELDALSAMEAQFEERILPPRYFIVLTHKVSGTRVPFGKTGGEYFSSLDEAKNALPEDMLMKISVAFEISIEKVPEFGE